eukprot:6782895-Prymnesium_polylepis.1
MPRWCKLLGFLLFVKSSGSHDTLRKASSAPLLTALMRPRNPTAFELRGRVTKKDFGGRLNCASPIGLAHR